MPSEDLTPIALDRAPHPPRLPENWDQTFAVIDCDTDAALAYLQAVCIGRRPSESYLNIPNLISGRISHADAPARYGFLSENALFAGRRAP